MFESFLTNISRPKQVEWSAPNKMLLDMGEGLKPYELMKGAEDYVHKQIELKVSTSRDVNRKAENIWGQLRDVQLQKCKDRPTENEQFALDKKTVVYITTVESDDSASGYVVDIVDLQNEAKIEDFEERMQRFNLDITTMNKTKKFFQDGKGGIIKFVCYDKNANIENDDYTPIILLELNHEKSLYKVYSGILIYKTFTFIPSVSCDIEENKYYDFISRFNMEELLEYSKQRAEELYQSYVKFTENPVDVSARELTAILKKVGYKLELDGVDKLHPIENLGDEVNNQKVQDFYNTFTFTTGETAQDILQLSDFRKTFRYNKMTLLELLGILSKEYMTYDGSKITADILGDIVFKLYSASSSDKAQVIQIEQEIN